MSAKINQLDGLLACVRQTEATLEDLDRAIVITGIGEELIGDMRICLARLAVSAKRAKAGHMAKQRPARNHSEPQS